VRSVAESTDEEHHSQIEGSDGSAAWQQYTSVPRYIIGDVMWDGPAIAIGESLRAILAAMWLC
jgi:hypothetical protein